MVSEADIPQPVLRRYLGCGVRLLLHNFLGRICQQRSTHVLSYTVPPLLSSPSESRRPCRWFSLLLRLLPVVILLDQIVDLFLEMRELLVIVFEDLNID